MTDYIARTFTFHYVSILIYAEIELDVPVTNLHSIMSLF